MPYKETQTGRYQLEGVSGFEGVQFTHASSGESMIESIINWFRTPRSLHYSPSLPGINWLELAEYVAKKGTVLQSVREAAAVRIEANGQDYADDFQMTRTTALYFRGEDGCLYVAFDDSPDPQQNIIIVSARERARELREAERKRIDWLLSREDTHVAQAILRASETDRIIPLTQEYVSQHEKRQGLSPSQFAKDPAAQAVVGDLTEHYINTLVQRGLIKGARIEFEWLKYLESVLNSENVVIRPIWLGYTIIHEIIANRYYGAGVARGVYGAREFSHL